MIARRGLSDTSAFSPTPTWCSSGFWRTLDNLIAPMWYNSGLSPCVIPPLVTPGVPQGSLQPGQSVQLPGNPQDTVNQVVTSTTTAQQSAWQDFFNQLPDTTTSTGTDWTTYAIAAALALGLALVFSRLGGRH